MKINTCKAIMFFLVMHLNFVTYAQTTKKDQLDVQHTVENMFKALREADTLALRKHVTADVNFYEYGQVWNRDTIVNKINQSKAIPDFKRLDRFEFVNTTIRKNTAWVTYYLESVFTRNGKEETVNWMETVILINDGKNWKISVLHSSRLSKK